MSPKDTIVGLLPKLSPGELDEVFTATKLARQLSGGFPEVVQGGPDSDWLVEGIARQLMNDGIVPGPLHLAVAHLRNYHKSAWKVYLANRPTSWLDLLEQQLSTTTRHRTRLALVLASALAEWLQKRNIYSPPLMLQYVHKLPQALNDSFPGYVRAGLFRVILEQL